MEPRPPALSIVSAFLFAATAMSLAVGVCLLFPDLPFDWMWQFNRRAQASFQAWGRVAGGLLLLLAAGTLAAGAGLLHRKRWAWWFAVVLFVINGCGDVVNWIVTGERWKSASGVLICGMFLYALGTARPKIS